MVSSLLNHLKIDEVLDTFNQMSEEVQEFII